MALAMDIALVIAAGLGSAGWFAASTTLGGQYSDAVLIAWATLLAAPFVLAASGLPLPKRLRSVSPSEVTSSAVGGFLAFFAAPLLVLTCRLTDAPSGTETLFFTTAAWGVMAVMGAAIAFRRETSLTQVGGSLLALLGAAAVVANWERPSSFSPFVKFPLLEVGMLVAGILFVAGTLMLARVARRIGPRPALSMAWTAAMLSSLTAVLATGHLPELFRVPSYVVPQVALAVLSTAGFALAWVFLLSRVGVARASSALFVPAPVLMAVAATEGATHAYGADPIQWPGALAGTVILALGAGCVFVYRPIGTEDPTSRHLVDRGSRFDVGALALAFGGAVLAVAALFAPAFRARIVGEFSGREFEVAWTMLGVESAGGWLPLALALLLMGAVVDARNGVLGAAWRRLGVAATILVSCAFMLPLESTPLRTWTRWIPAEVLQDLGTEYAHLTLTAVSQPIAIAALVVLAVGAGSIVGGAFVWGAAARRAEGRA